MKSIDYEVVRQKGGDLALTMNSGVLPRPPEAIQLFAGGLYLFAPDDRGALEVVGWVGSPPSDVLEHAMSKEGLLVVELSTLGVRSARSLRLEEFQVA